jgi:hypothetical protein
MTSGIAGDGQGLNGLEYAAAFLSRNLGADWLEDPGSVEQALSDYLASQWTDSDGSRLREELQTLIDEDLTDADLKRLIEQEWHGMASSESVGSYRQVLLRVRDMIDRRGS